MTRMRSGTSAVFVSRHFIVLRSPSFKNDLGRSDDKLELLEALSFRFFPLRRGSARLESLSHMLDRVFEVSDSRPSLRVLMDFETDSFLFIKRFFLNTGDSKTDGR